MMISLCQCLIYVTQPDDKCMNCKMNHLHLSWKMISHYHSNTSQGQFWQKEVFLETPCMNNLHTCCWWLDNQSPNITCWNSYFRWLHHRGNVPIGLVLNYCKCLLPRKIESWLVFLFSLNEDASWGSFGSFAKMLAASRLRWWKTARWYGRRHMQEQKFLTIWKFGSHQRPL